MLAGCFNPTGQTTEASGASEGPGTTGTGEGTTGSTGGITSTTTGSTGAPATTTTGSTGGPATTGPGTTTDPSTGGDCPICPEWTPYCVDGRCLSCVDLPAHGLDCNLDGVDTPLCDADSGKCVGCLDDEHCVGVCHTELKQCVQCQNGLGCQIFEVCDEATNLCVECLTDADCPGAKPICDGNTCRSCERHSECSEGACNMKDGTCFPEQTRHLYVSEADCLGPPCDQMSPCCEIDDVIAQIKQSAATHFIIHVGIGDYSPFVVDFDGKHIALLADAGANITADGIDPPGPLITFSDPTDTAGLYISGLTFTGEGTTGLFCENGGFATIDDALFQNFVGTAADVTQCTLKVRRSEVLGSGGGFVVNQFATLLVENSIIAGLTGKQPALAVGSGGEMKVVYSTVALHTFADGGLITCVGAGPNIRNSALLAALPGNGQFVLCNTVAITDSVTTETELGGPGVSYVLPANVKAPFVNWDNLELRLKNGQSFLDDVARWKAGDPRTDIDDAKRPTVPDSADVAGADLPP